MEIVWNVCNPSFPTHGDGANSNKAKRLQGNAITRHATDVLFYYRTLPLTVRVPIEAICDGICQSPAAKPGDADRPAALHVRICRGSFWDDRVMQVICQRFCDATGKVCELDALGAVHVRLALPFTKCQTRGCRGGSTFLTQPFCLAVSIL